MKWLTRDRVVADHVGKGFLADLGDNRLGLALLAEIGQEQQHAGKPFFRRVEQLIDQVFFHAGVAGEDVGNEDLRERGLVLQHPYDLSLVDPHRQAVPSWRSRLPGRRGCPIRHPSPRNWSGPKIATTASLPCVDTTVTLIRPSLM